MDTPTSDLPPAPPVEVPALETAGNWSRARSMPSQALVELWPPHEPAGAAELPENLAALGDALRRAQELGGAVGQAYIEFADQAVAAPGTLPAFSGFVTRLFANEPGVLINLVRTMDLIAELEHGGNELTRMVALRWQEGTMTQRISRFGESMINHQESLKNPVAAEALAAFACLLALSKPKRAAGLFQLATKISDPPGRQNFVDNVRSWLAAGELTDPMSPEDRAFWQQCLHQSEADSDWSSAEACSALNALAGRLKLEMPCAGLFQQRVPSSWWAKHMSGQTAAEPVTSAAKTDAPDKLPILHEEAGPTPLPATARETDSSVLPVPAPIPAKPITLEPALTSTAKHPNKPDVAAAPPVVVRTSNARMFLAGQLLGMALVAGLWGIQPDLLARALGAAQRHWFGEPVATTEPALPALPAYSTATPASEAPAAKRHWFDDFFATITQARPASATSASQTPAVPKALPLSKGEEWRFHEIASLAASHAAMKPWVTKVQDSTWAESAQLVGGTHPTAYPTVQDYRVFLMWLMLDPPRNTEVRHAVPKQFLRASPLPELIELCEHLSYPGSPAAQDIPTLAQIAMEMHSGVLTSEEHKRLQKLASAH